MCNGLPVLATVLALLLIPGVAGAQGSPGRVDQVSPLDTAAPFTWAIGGGSQQKLAQVVTVGRPPLKAIQVGVGCDHSDPDAELILSIVNVNDDGRPSSTIWAMERFPVTDLPNVVDGQLVTLEITPPLGLRPGIRFAFVLESSGSCGMVPGSMGDLYAGGDGYYDSRPNPPGWVPISNGTDRFDLGFQTLRMIK